MTTNSIDLSALPGGEADYRRLTHVGFSHRQIQFLLSAKDTAAQQKYRHTFNKSQLGVLSPGGATMKSLLTIGKLTRAQAKLLLELGLV